MILIDTSAWVEWLRDTAGPAADRVEELQARDAATCHPVRTELLAGARDEGQLRDLRRLLGRATLVQTHPTDFEDAATLYRVCRRQGETVRKLIDCLIAAHAIRTGVALLHADADFDVLARHTPLRVDGAARVDAPAGLRRR